MKIKMLTVTHTSSLYGANKSLLNLIDGLMKKNVEIVVLCMKKGPLIQELTKRNIEYHIYPYIWDFYKENERENTKVPKRCIKNWLEAIKNLSSFRKINPDIIHSNSSVINFGAYLSYLMGKPHIWHIREFGYDDFELLPERGEKHFHKWIKKAFIISISDSVEKKRFSKIPEANKNVIYNGVYSEEFINSIPENDRTNRKLFRFAIIGQLSPKKNQLEALKAFKLLTDQRKNVELFIIGDYGDKYQSELNNFIQKYSLKNQVTLPGYIKDIESIFRDTDCLLMCSQKEGMGRVTAEAMAHGVPVIGKSTGGTVELIDHNVNGFLYGNGIPEMVTYMKQLVDNKGLKEQMGRSARKKALEMFTIERCSEKFYNKICEIVNSKI